MTVTLDRGVSGRPAVAPPGRIFVCVALIAGAMLRVAWGGDIEYKADERYTFEQTRTTAALRELPPAGMPSSVGLPNPGMSVWAFRALARVFRADTPPALARGVQITNVVALVALAVVALQLIPASERALWLWATVFAAVNPTALLLQRKIWPQSLLPLFCVLMLASWLRRDRTLPAFCWGAIGALLGQIHMSGFFWAAAVALWTRGSETMLRLPRRANWTAWLSGTLAGALTLVPWVRVLSAAPSQASLSVWGLDRPWRAILTTQPWLWAVDALGLALRNALGHRGFIEFLQAPVLGGQPTYLVALVHVAIVVASAAGVAGSLAWLRHSKDVIGWRTLAAGDGSDTGVLLGAALWAYGAMLTAVGVQLYHHYLAVTFPLEWVALAWLAGKGANGARMLRVLFVAQLCVSIAFLSYIHVHHGAPDGDYGVAFSYQGGR